MLTAYALGERTVPKVRYTSPEFLALELDRVFARTWHLAGPAADVEGPGAYFTFEIGDASILVVRTEGGVRAFHNVCRHRGRVLREPGLGQARSFRCPYHHWEYGLDGALVHLPCADAFTGCPPRESLGLTPVAAEVCEGFVWISLHPSPEPLREFLGPVAPLLAAYHLADYALESDETLELPCNWKVSADAFNEAYHVPAIHPQILQITDASRATIELLGRHSVISLPFGVPDPRAAEPRAVGAMLQHMMREAGVDPATYTGDATGVRAAMQHALRARADLDLAQLTDAQLTDNHQFYLFPSVALNVYGTRILLHRHRPHPTNPGRMLLDQQQYVRVPRGAARPPRPKHTQASYGQGSLGTVTDQDTANIVRAQRGLSARGCERFVLGDLEARIMHMHRMIDEYLARP